METKRIVFLGTAISLLLLFALPGMAPAEIFNVTTATELRQAMGAADQNLEEDTINIAAGTYSTDDTGNEPFVYAPHNTDEVYPLTIVGAGAGTTIIDGGWDGGTATDGTPAMIIDLTVFRGDESDDGEDDSAAVINISGITVQNANNMTYTTTNDYDNYGGLSVITNRADVTIGNCRFTQNNNADSWEAGGGLFVNSWRGDISLSNSTITDNHGLTQSGYQMDNGAGAALQTGRGNPKGHLDDSSNVATEMDEGSVTVTNCTFSQNGGDYVAWGRYGAPSADGGGLSARASRGNITITNSAFTDNIAGGRYADGGGVSAMTFFGDIIFTGNTVTGNMASENGGGAAIYSKFGQATVSDNIFEDNQLQPPPDYSSSNVTDGGGLHVLALNGSTVINNRFINNNTTGTSSYGSDGGGAHIGTYQDPLDGGTCDFNDPCATAGTEIKWNTFKNNTADNTGSYNKADGGGLHARVKGDFTLDAAYNTFISNTAEACGGGALFNNPSGTILLRSNYFYDNMTDTGLSSHGIAGGGAFIDTAFGSAYVINNTFDANTTAEYGGGGLAVNLQDDLSVAKIYNNIFYDNDAGNGNGNDIYINDLDSDPRPPGSMHDPADLVTDNTGAVVVLDTNRYDDAYILSRDGADSANDFPNITESGTVTEDPLFLAVGSPQLAPNSPMIDAANESALNPYQLPLFDIFGVERADAAPLDIGAHEEAGFGVSSTNSTVALRPSPAMPSGIDDVLHVAGFTATGVTDSADISITFPSIPDDFTIYKVFASGQSVEIYPTNNAETKGITNVRLNGRVLSLTIEDNSDADLDDTVGSIDDPIVLAEEETASSVYVKDDDDDDVCFIDTIMGGF